jgi:hypothetical protein
MGAPINWQALDDEAFVDRAEQQIWLSAFASNNPRAPAHKEVDAAYDEAQRRERPWLYQRAYNAAFRSCGYTPSEAEIEQAKAPDALPSGADHG